MSHPPEGTNCSCPLCVPEKYMRTDTTCLLCGIETNGMYHQCIVPVGAKGASMYQIYLVIKEDMKDEIGSMLISGHANLSSAAEQYFIDFQRLRDANEISAKVDRLLLALENPGEGNEMIAETFSKVIKQHLQ